METNRELEQLQTEIMGSLSYYVTLRKIVKENGTAHLYPIFEDDVFNNILNARERVETIRGY